MAEREFTPWRVHDGGAPVEWPRDWPFVEVIGINLREGPKTVTGNHPEFYWRWSWFRLRRIPQPGWGCITSYRFFREKPKAVEKSEQVEVLREIAAGKRQPESEDA